MKEIAKKIIMAAIAAKTPCIVDFKEGGIQLSSRDGMHEYEQALELYTPNYEDINGTTGIRIYNTGDKTPVGNLFIKWPDVRKVVINYDYGVFGRYHIKLDNLTLNFTSSIENFEL